MGTEYNSNGTVNSSGNWRNSVLDSSFFIAPELFPFNPSNEIADSL